MFIVVEGGDGTGKTTQTALLAERLQRTGTASIVLREPGGTGLGSAIRSLVKSEQPFPINPRAELLLFAASRAQLVEEVITPALAEGQVVICDRYIYSTVAYQGAGRGLDLQMIEMVNTVATSGVLPDLVILLDLPEDEAFRRQHGREADRFDGETTAFYQRVRASYLDQAQANPARWAVIDASPHIEQVAARIGEIVQQRQLQG